MSSTNERNLSSPRIVRELLAKEGIRPLKRWGQNFLVDLNTLNRIIDAANLLPNDGVLEIGTGLGTLTQALATKAERVVTVEIDPLLKRILETTLSETMNVTIIEGDFLKLKLDELIAPLGQRPIRVVANVPYYITSPIIERLLEHKKDFTRIVLLVQKEYAARLSAEPDTPEYGALTLFAQYHSHVVTELMVSKNVFYPSPEVDSAVVSLTPIPPRLLPEVERVFFLCTRAAFRARRKTIINALTAGLSEEYSRQTISEALEHVGINPNRRGETMGLVEYLNLAEYLSGH